MAVTDKTEPRTGAELGAAAAEAPIVGDSTVEGASSSSAPARNAAHELVEAFFRGRNAKTLHEYRRDLKDFAVFLGFSSGEDAARALLTATPGDANGHVLRFRAAMLEHRLAPATINRRLAALRALVKLARMLGMVTWAIEVENLVSEPYRDTRGPGGPAVAAMLEAAAERGDAKGLRDVAIVRLLHDCGLRRGEVVSFDREHYSVLRGLSLLGKGRRERSWITLPAVTRRALEAWLAVRGAAPGPLFVALSDNHQGHRLTGGAVYLIVKELGAEVGVKTWPHGLRHTAITTALDRTNGNMREVQRFSRHRDVQTIELYDDARRDGGGKVAELVALPDSHPRGLVVSCAAGHVYDKTTIGKFCCKDSCGEDRGNRDPKRRIEWR